MFHPAAVILAAGRGSRIGMPKHRIVTPDGTFLQMTIRLARSAGCSPVLCVLAADEAAHGPAGNSDSVTVVVNPDPARGMLSSIREALAVLAATEGIMVFPVDHPYVTVPTVVRLLEHVATHPHAVVKPEYGGRGGHPVYIPAFLFPALAGAGEGATLRTVIAASRVPVIRVPVDDEAVVRNINTPGDLR